MPRTSNIFFLYLDTASYKVAFITGASSGIGAATAEALAKSGIKVALFARRKDRLIELAKKINDAGGKAIPLAGDVTIRQQVHKQ